MEETETQEELEKGIGNKETESLKPATVKIVKVSVESINSMKKVVCSAKHPDREELINISRVKYLGKNEKLSTVGIWYKEDSEGNIQKGTALAEFLIFNTAESIKQLEGKEIETITEDSGYLCFKGY